MPKWDAPYETHVITSRDGLRLAGHYLPAFSAGRGQTPEFILLCIHGYRSNSFKEYSAYRSFYHDRLRADLWFPDQRAHGESEGQYICYGVKERFDILDWLAYINRHAEAQYGSTLPIYLHGISMGCATVLLAHGAGCPENVRGIIADCGYTSPEDIFRHILKRAYHLPPFPVMPLANFLCRKIAGFDFRTGSVPEALHSAGQSSLPILFIHGGSDHYVPTEMSRKNYEAYPGKKKLLLMEGAGHAQSYSADPEAYEAAVRELIFSPQSF